ncbi:MAG: 2-amino-4-hydroxy-6-hydroxymethyldihydropteridine diphosphokinase [Actinomycetota bacterium]
MTGTAALVALGSNVGDRLAHLRRAVAAIDALDGTRVEQVSALYQSAPVGGPDGQGPFLNGALSATTVQAASELLAALHAIEASHDRERVVHWGPRTLDLDLIEYGNTLSDDSALLLPHPRAHERRFVLVPICDVAASWRHARLGSTMADLLAALPVEPGDLTRLDGDWLDLDWQLPTTDDQHRDR